MKQSSLRVLGCAIMMATMLAGCRGTGEVRYLDLREKPPMVQVTDIEPVKIAIEPFDDRRGDKSRVGTRSHLWGGTTQFDVLGDRPAGAITQRLADRLRTRGWRDRVWNVRVAPAGSAAEADIVISGQVQDFSATVKSRVFSTVIDTTSRFTIQARNLVDRSTTIRTIEGGRSRTVFWFNEDDVREQLAATLKDGLDRLIVDTTIDNKALRPARRLLQE
ncbi:YajG family lipoprotein [Candidatus Nitrospira nitrificans]|uniref:Lipoprotein n=1 Tax=Candidatus Nitrospira nitrificans TaxID=1742973 RepID=A0A0S4LJL1_9BACT|nr:hypothetical protein [Candidatus Nitrospira nitrificans]CUS36784.1 conserved exported hypothetical protein [Candidatus Nitrospira nitrificans]